MLIMLSGIVMLVRSVQSLNAKLPMFVTLFGIIMFVKEHASNALSAIPVVPSLICKSLPLPDMTQVSTYSMPPSCSIIAVQP